ncbi:MAG TPA: ThuA domain-containing protein, partial [Gemmataceae bacterium]|nr:ThuA domain-containing protein [Gemmataceae bacterium]
DEPWKDGAKIVDKADGLVLFLAEGAKWSQQDAKRAEALAKLAARGGGIVALHWAIGTKDPQPVQPFLQLLGGCHGGPDRKYKVLETVVQVADRKHPVTTEIEHFKVRDEFYYQLKFIKPEGSIKPLLKVTIEDRPQTVAWSWERPDGGRSFGFSGLHYHENWGLPEYRRLVAQGVLWTMKIQVPDKGLNVILPKEDLPIK